MKLLKDEELREYTIEEIERWPNSKWALIVPSPAFASVLMDQARLANKLVGVLREIADVNYSGDTDYLYEELQDKAREALKEVEV